MQRRASPPAPRVGERCAQLPRQASRHVRPGPWAEYRCSPSALQDPALAIRCPRDSSLDHAPNRSRGRLRRSSNRSRDRSSRSSNRSSFLFRYQVPASCTAKPVPMAVQAIAVHCPSSTRRLYHRIPDRSVSLGGAWWAPHGVSALEDPDDLARDGPRQAALDRHPLPFGRRVHQHVGGDREPGRVVG